MVKTMAKSNTCNHNWKFNSYGYSFCSLCGCARETGKCVECGREQLEMYKLVDKNTQGYKFCSFKCLHNYLGEIVNE